MADSVFTQSTEPISEKVAIYTVHTTDWVVIGCFLSLYRQDESIHNESISSVLSHAPGSCPSACLWKTPISHQLQVSHEAAAAAARREKGSSSKVLRSKDAASEEGVESDTRMFSAPLHCFHCLPGDIPKPFTFRRCEAPINTD